MVWIKIYFPMVGHIIILYIITYFTYLLILTYTYLLIIYYILTYIIIILYYCSSLFNEIDHYHIVDLVAQYQSFECP